MLFGLGYGNFKIFLLKILGEKEFSKKPCFVQSWGIFSVFSAKYLVFDDGDN